MSTGPTFADYAGSIPRWAVVECLSRTFNKEGLITDAVQIWDANGNIRGWRHCGNLSLRAKERTECNETYNFTSLQLPAHLVIWGGIYSYFCRTRNENLQDWDISVYWKSCLGLICIHSQKVHPYWRAVCISLLHRPTWSLRSKSLSTVCLSTSPLDLSAGWWPRCRCRTLGGGLSCIQKNGRMEVVQMRSKGMLTSTSIGNSQEISDFTSDWERTNDSFYKLQHTMYHMIWFLRSFWPL